MLRQLLPLVVASVAFAAEPPPATHADVSYGAHPHQLIDIYLPKTGDGPFPVLLWFGGIFAEPTKRPVDPNRFLPKGIAIVAVEVRSMKDATSEHEPVPASYVLNDACRAVQFVRLNAAKWKLDPARIAVGGGSQGSLPALFVGCTPDRANPAATDPVERVSSRVVAVAAYRSQPSIDPQRMQEWVPGVKWGAPALGMDFDKSLAQREQLLPLIRKWSPDHLLHRDAAPMYFENEWGLTQPEGFTVENYKVHSPAWALGFQKLAQAAGATCFVKFPGHPTDGYDDIWDFLAKSLTNPKPSSAR